MRSVTQVDVLCNRETKDTKWVDVQDPHRWIFCHFLLSFQMIVFPFISSQSVFAGVTTVNCWEAKSVYWNTILTATQPQELLFPIWTQTESRCHGRKFNKQLHPERSSSEIPRLSSKPGVFFIIAPRRPAARSLPRESPSLPVIGMQRQ